MTAIDAFADQQTVAVAHATFVVPYDEYGLNAQALLDIIAKFDANEYLGFVYGSGFEAQASLLEKLAKFIPLIGNLPSSVQAVKSPTGFFAALMQNSIHYPQTYIAQDVTRSSSGQLQTAGYLQKFSGGCGGTHIQKMSDTWLSHASYYFQEPMVGRPVSLLFLADAHHIAVVGFNEQWLSPTATMPFRYGGAVSQIKLSANVAQQLRYAAQTLTQQFSLVGLNSLDAIVRDDIAYILEINPRLSASFDLYESDLAQMNLMHRHIQTSLQAMSLQTLHLKEYVPVKLQSKAHAVIYAAQDMQIAATFVWPAWVQDCPYLPLNSASMRFLAGQPICTVVAQAVDADTAKQAVYARVNIIKHLLEIDLHKDEYANS